MWSGRCRSPYITLLHVEKRRKEGRNKGEGEGRGGEREEKREKEKRKKERERKQRNILKKTEAPAEHTAKTQSLWYHSCK